MKTQRKILYKLLKTTNLCIPEALLAIIADFSCVGKGIVATLSSVSSILTFGPSASLPPQTFYELGLNFCVTEPKWCFPNIYADFNHGIEIHNEGETVSSLDVCAIPNIVIKQNTGKFSLKLKIMNEIGFPLPAIGFILPTKRVRKERFVRLFSPDGSWAHELCDGWMYDAGRNEAQLNQNCRICIEDFFDIDDMDDPYLQKSDMLEMGLSTTSLFHQF